MESTTKIKAVTLAVLCAAIFTVAAYGLWFHHGGPDTVVRGSTDPLLGWKYPADKFPPVALSQYQFSFSRSDAHSNLRDPGGLPRGFPVRLKIPVIGVDSVVEDAVYTPEGRMDMPTGSVNVAWFSLGPPPGDEGSAVIGGHFGINNEVPFVFEHLNELTVGDKVYIENDRGDTYAFIVRSIRLFDRNADATAVFTSEDGLAHLNLVTCEGIWNQVEGMYEERRVVFSDRIESEGAVVVTPIQTMTTSPTPAPSPMQTPVPKDLPVQSSRSYFGTPTGKLIVSLVIMLVVLAVYKIIVR